jgi:predicted PurR-regulated permease PerM
MSGLYFLVVAVVLYFVADRILEFIEVRRGARFEQRTIVFFFILLTLALVTFAVIQRLQGS